MRHLALALALLLPAAPGLAADVADAPDSAARLRDLFSREWELRLKEDPLTATSVGRHEYDDRLPAIAPADLERRAEADAASSPSWRRSTVPGSGAEDQVNYDMFRRQLEDRIADYELGGYQMPFNADSGFHSGFSRLPDERAARDRAGLRELHRPPARLAALRRPSRSR